MKKITAILLCVIMVISCFSTAVYAETSTPVIMTQEFCDDVNSYVIELGLNSLFFNPVSGENDFIFTPENIDTHYYISVFSTTEDTAIFQLKNIVPPGTTPEERVYDKIGDYTFCANYRFTNDNITGHCYYTNGTVYSIREAVEQNLVTLEELAVTIPETSPTPEMVALLKLFNEYDHCSSGEIVWADKLGDVGDFELYYVDTNPYVEAGTKIKVGYYTFNTKIDYRHIRLYLKNGETIHYLPDAYYDGLITDEDMDAIYDVIYNEENKDRYYNWTITKETVVKVNQKFCDAVNQYVIDLGKGRDLFGEIMGDDGTVTYLDKLTPENIHIWADEEYSENGWNRDFHLFYYDEETETAVFRIGQPIVGGRSFLVIGDYTYHSGSVLHWDKNELGYCYYEKGVVYTFTEAYNENRVTDKQLADYVTKGGYTPDYTPCYDEDKIRFAEFRDCPIEDFDMHNEFYPYGIVDGYRMYFGWNYKSSDVEVKKRMGDYIFSSSNTDYPSAFSLYLISDEEIITLEDAYDSGKLKDIDTVAYMVMHNNWIGVLISKFEPTAEEQALIDYHTNKGTFYEGPESDYYGYKMLGEVQEYKLCHFTCEQPIPGGWSHHLGDYRIEAVFRESLYLVKDNEVVELQEAYDKGILTDVVTVVDILKETTGYEVFEKGEIKDPVGPYVTIASDRIKSGEKAKLLTVENVGDAEITFTSKTPEIAKVNQKGVVTALQKGMAEFEITFVDDTGKGKFTAKVKVTNNPKLEQKKVTINRKDTIKVAIKGKVKGIKNVYTNTKIAKIKSKPNASVLKVKGIKKGKTTLEIKVNGVKTLKLKVVVK